MKLQLKTAALQLSGNFENMFVTHCESNDITDDAHPVSVISGLAAQLRVLVVCMHNWEGVISCPQKEAKVFVKTMVLGVCYEIRCVMSLFLGHN